MSDPDMASPQLLIEPASGGFTSHNEREASIALQSLREIVSSSSSEVLPPRIRYLPLIIPPENNQANHTRNSQEHRESKHSNQSISGPDQIRISEKDAFSNIPLPPAPNRTLGDSLIARYSSKMKSQKTKRVAFAEPSHQDNNHSNNSYFASSELYGNDIPDDVRQALRNASISSLSLSGNQSNHTNPTTVSTNGSCKMAPIKWMIFGSVHGVFLLCILLIGYREYINSQ